MSTHNFTDERKNAIQITPIIQKDFKFWLQKQSKQQQRWLATASFQAKPGTHCLLPNGQGKLHTVLLGIKDENDFWSFGALPAVLAAGSYYLEEKYGAFLQQRIALAWGLGSYQFTQYKKAKPVAAKLVLSKNVDKKQLKLFLNTVFFVRDSINTTAEDFNPETLANAAEKIAKQHAADFKQIIGEDLLAENYPLIHAVGRAAKHAPRLIDLSWGDTTHPKLTLVGKGVCFDTGGLDIKLGSSMRLMKKDMGGAAQVLGLASLIMAERWPVRLRVLVPAVENAISEKSYRPGDVFIARDGTSVEITDTDAEGRLVLADALCEAVREKPAMIVDFATLTGAQRVALGPDVPSFFTTDEKFSTALLSTGKQYQDPVWPLPLFEEYQKYLHSDIADISNSSNQSYAGAIIAALFLQRFVGKNITWCHFDFMAFNLEARPGRPKGGEAQGIFAVYYALKNFFKLSSCSQYEGVGVRGMRE